MRGVPTVPYHLLCRNPELWVGTDQPEAIADACKVGSITRASDNLSSLCVPLRASAAVWFCAGSFCREEGLSFDSGIYGRKQVSPAGLLALRWLVDSFFTSPVRPRRLVGKKKKKKLEGRAGFLASALARRPYSKAGKARQFEIFEDIPWTGSLLR
mmetsp:Transcript_7072/g.31217  ORF Transcript_7072/g.31217 Transcript_7072/m.31217 type:complete len:156 (-) Transcript_7072:2002-2469(-)